MAANQDVLRKLDEALTALNILSIDADKAGDDVVRYAANRAWHEIFEAHKIRFKDRATSPFLMTLCRAEVKCTGSFRRDRTATGNGDGPRGNRPIKARTF
jgi:hypothetical protein